ncbi:nitroreductase [Spirochaetia bacterium]|nr:nitroreductase [Spirochaetia bacterium]
MGSMDIMDAISKRRSVRKFIDKDIGRDILEKIIGAGVMAPSPKNMQNWKFIVVSGAKKGEMLDIMKKGIENIKTIDQLSEGREYFIASLEHTMGIMKEAPVTVFVINTANKHVLGQTMQEKFYEMANIQAIGAAIQNMLIAACGYGIGSLWISDIFFAYYDFCKWFNTDDQLVAAVSFGYFEDTVRRKKRKKLEEVVEWR